LDTRSSSIAGLLVTPVHSAVRTEEIPGDNTVKPAPRCTAGEAAAEMPDFQGKKPKTEFQFVILP
jgi:hypothetical protein